MTLATNASFVPRLCGGVFLSLLDASKKASSIKRKQFGANGSGITFTDMLMDLVRIAKPNIVFPMVQTLKSPATNYRKCDISSSAHFPFCDPPFVSSFVERMTIHYDSTLADMRSFVFKYFDTQEIENCQPLVKGLLETILLDDTISDTDQFIYAQNQPVFKPQFCNQSDYDLPQFLLAIWFFIVQNRPDNTVGKDTFLAWHTQAGERAPWRYSGTVGKTITRLFSVHIIDNAYPSINSTPLTEATTEPKQTTAPDQTQDMDRVLALWASVQGTRLDAIKKGNDIAPSELDYVYPLFAAYGEHLKRNVSGKADLTTRLQMDLEMRREHFFAAETVRLQGELALGSIIRGEFADLKSDILSSVWNTYMDTYSDGYQRMRHVMLEASKANCTKGNLIKTGWIGSGEKQGIGHMLAAEKALVWVVDENE